MALDPTAAKPPDTFIKIGRLGRTFQLEGALRVRLDDAVSYEDEDGLEPVGLRAVRAAGQLFVTGLGNARVRELYESGGSLLLKLEGVRERNAAQSLVNSTLWVDPEKLPAELARELTDEVEAGSTEERLVGQPVLLNGEVVGQISAAMLDNPNPVLEVTVHTAATQGDPSAAGKPAATPGVRTGPKSLIPLQAPYVELTESGLVLTDPPEGLLELG